MKKLLVALGFAVASIGAQATSLPLGPALILDNNGTDAITQVFDPVPNPALVLPIGSTFLTGTVKALHEGTFYATFLGSESGWTNFYMDNASTIIENNASLGTTAAMYVAGPGVVDFGFGTLSPTGKPSHYNGQTNTGIIGIGYLLNTWGFKDADGNVFDFLIGFNDAFAGHHDHDDMVMGARFVPTPVPAALPLLATGLALFGFSRRKSV